MDYQETYDKVAAHLLTQGRRSMIPVNAIGTQSGCAYRGEDDCKCAFGILIPDLEYDMAMEGSALPGVTPSDMDGGVAQMGGRRMARALLEEFLRRHGWFNDGDLNFLRGLQVIHDTEIPQEWALHLRNFAQVHHLSCAVVNEMEGYPA